MSKCGIDFLKCAFAAPDFDSTGAQGIPDNYVGKTLCSLQTFSSSFQAPAGVDTYILVSPLFGSAFLSAASTTPGGNPVAFGSTSWPGAQNLGIFSAPQGTGTVSKFRYASLAAELQCTMNEMTWSGSITSWKIPMSVEVTNSVTTVALIPSELYTVSGLVNLATTPLNNIYTAPINRGAYSVSYNRTGSFDFQNVVADPSPGNTYGIPTGSAGPTLNMAYRGIDNLDTIVYRISVPTGAQAQSLILRTWACVEMQVQPSTFVYEFTNLSCPHDQAALEMYKMIAERLPVAVPYADNANFWARVLAFIRSASSTLSKLPGPVGDIASGVNLISAGIGGLAF
jgi:hypothetical protein